MADPTKHETEQVFKVLKSQKGNKVSFFFLYIYVSNNEANVVVMIL